MVNIMMCSEYELAFLTKVINIFKILYYNCFKNEERILYIPVLLLIFYIWHT